MKTFLLSVFSLVTAAVFSGCVAAPVREPKQASYPTAGDTAILVGSTAAGAVGGHAINSKYGGEVGGVVGLGAGLLINKIKNDHEKALWQEAYEAGRREGRLEVLRKIHGSQQAADSSQPESDPVVHYEQGTVEGVRFAPRDSTSPTLEEPTR